MLDKERIMVMTSLAMQEQETPGISRVLPRKREYIRSRIAVFLVVWSLLYLLLGLGLLALLMSEAVSRGVIVYILVAIVVLLVYVIVSYMGISLIRRYAKEKYESLLEAQRRYIHDMDRLGELYEDE